MRAMMVNRGLRFFQVAKACNFSLKSPARKRAIRKIIARRAGTEPAYAILAASIPRHLVYI